MTADIIVHIGAPKCGSTYLQRVLLKNRRQLQDAGILYPYIGTGHPGNGNLLSILTKSWLDEKLAKFGTIVFSHEDLFALPTRGLRLRKLACTAGVTVQLVAFVRPFNGWLNADYSQTLYQHQQSRTVPPFVNYLDFVQARKSKLPVTRFLQDWAKLFPRYPILIAQHSRIKDTFCDLNPAFQKISWDLPEWRCNPSMSHDLACQLHVALLKGQPGYAKELLADRHDKKSKHPPPSVDALFELERHAMLNQHGVTL